MPNYHTPFGHLRNALDFMIRIGSGKHVLERTPQTQTYQSSCLPNVTMLPCFQNHRKRKATFCLPNKVLSYRIAPGATDIDRMFAITVDASFPVWTTLDEGFDSWRHVANIRDALRSCQQHASVASHRENLFRVC